MRNANPDHMPIDALNILLNINADRIGQIVSTMLNAVNSRAVCSLRTIRGRKHRKPGDMPPASRDNPPPINNKQQNNTQRNKNK